MKFSYSRPRASIFLVALFILQAEALASGPAEALSKWLKYFQFRNYSAMYDLLSQRCRDYQTREEFIAQYKDGWDPYILKSYTVYPDVEYSTDGKTAEVQYSMTVDILITEKTFFETAHLVKEEGKWRSQTRDCIDAVSETSQAPPPPIEDQLEFIAKDAVSSFSKHIKRVLHAWARWEDTGYKVDLGIELNPSSVDCELAFDIAGQFNAAIWRSKPKIRQTRVDIEYRKDDGEYEYLLVAMVARREAMEDFEMWTAPRHQDSGRDFIGWVLENRHTDFRDPGNNTDVGGRCAR